jgi:hypothetical protein
MSERKDSVGDSNGNSRPVAGLSTGPGSGHTCDACRQPIETSQVECRTANRAESSQAPLRFHQWCYYAKFANNR